MDYRPVRWAQLEPIITPIDDGLYQCTGVDVFGIGRTVGQALKNWRFAVSAQAGVFERDLRNGSVRTYHHRRESVIE